jgi:hypothetical protein
MFGVVVGKNDKSAGKVDDKVEVVLFNNSEKSV